MPQGMGSLTYINMHFLKAQAAPGHNFRSNGALPSPVRRNFRFKSHCEGQLVGLWRDEE